MMGRRRMRVSADIIESVMRDGIGACNPQTPMPRDAELCSVTFDEDGFGRRLVVLEFKSSEWTNPEPEDWSPVFTRKGV